MDAQGWVAVIGAIFAGMVLLLNTYLGWKNSQKIDNNTAITQAGTRAAANSAATAAYAARDSADTVKAIDKKLNGGIDSAIKQAIEPLQTALMVHIEQDAKDIAGVKEVLNQFVTNSKLEEFSDYVHKRNHDMIDAINKHSLKMDVVLDNIKDTKKGPK